MKRAGRKVKNKDVEDNIDLGSRMVAAVIEKGHTPLFLISGKEIGEGFRDYSIACYKDLPRDYVIYVLGRILKHLDGSISSETQRN